VLGAGGDGAHLETLALDSLDIEGDDLPDLGASQTIVMPVDHTIERQSTADEADTKLNLAKAYIELGDAEGARSILQEVAVDGTPAQQSEAKTLLGRLKA
jgi:pilus assembly protein FimV